jgi:hypothetical protein
MVGGCGEEKAVERVRNPEDGTYPVWKAGGEWTRRSSSVVGETELHGRCCIRPGNRLMAARAVG